MEGNKTIDYGGIGWAVNHMRHGHKMRRRGWTKIEYVAYVPEGSTQIPNKFAGGHHSGQFLVAKVAEGLVSWTATQGDLLAGDWELVDAIQPGEHHDTRSSQGQEQASA